MALKELSRFIVKLSWRDKILLLLLSAGAVAETVIDELYVPRPSLSSPRYFDGYAFKQSPYFRREMTQLRVELARLLSKKWIEYKGEWGERRYYLTAEGLNHLFSGFPILKHRQKPWDGKWRLVIYDIKESDKALRERLRTELKHLGFIFVQKSAWLTPYSVEEDLKKFLKAQGLWGKILVFKAQLPLSESRKLIKLFHHGPAISSSAKDAPALSNSLRSLFSYQSLR